MTLVLLGLGVLVLILSPFVALIMQGEQFEPLPDDPPVMAYLAAIERLSARFEEIGGAIADVLRPALIRVSQALDEYRATREERVRK